MSERESGEPLIDCHAHFLHAGCGRADWQDVNAARFRAGARIGITCHVASVLGTYGFSSPTYFPSPADVSLGNDAMLELCEHQGGSSTTSGSSHAVSSITSGSSHAVSSITSGSSHRGDREHPRVGVCMMVTVNPNHTAHSIAEIERCLARGGADVVGVKLLASRRADDPLLDPICALAAEHALPVLHHIWQHRRREWPSQEISDGADLARLAVRHPEVSFILAHIGGGGDYHHTFHAVKESPNIYPDLSGSGVDRGMLDDAIKQLGPRRLLWGTDLTMETGLAKLRALDATGLLSPDDLRDVRWRNAARIFPRAAFDS